MFGIFGISNKVKDELSEHKTRNKVKLEVIYRPASLVVDCGRAFLSWKTDIFDTWNTKLHYLTRTILKLRLI